MKASKPYGLYFNYLVLLILFLAFSLKINSQPTNFIFKHLSVEDGLSQSTVHSIFQDRNGFMWFGTDIGLNKYDGHKFVVYQNNAFDTTTIASNFIVKIFEDSFGYLWIGNGYNGLDRFDREKEVFTHYINKSNCNNCISSNNIRDIFEDKNKNLWIGTSGGGLSLYNRKTDSFTHILKDPTNHNSIGSNHITGISEDSKGNLWMGSTEGILIKYNPSSKQFRNFLLYGQYKTDIYNTTFCTTYVDSNDCVWFCSEWGLFVYDQQTDKITHYLKTDKESSINVNAVSSIIEYEKDFFLIGTDHGGLNIFNKKTGKFSYLLNKRYDITTISNNQLYCIYRSPDGILWLGSFHGGINILDKNASKFDQYKYLISENYALNCCNSVLTMSEDKDLNIWIGYDGQGIEIYNPTNRTIKHLLPEPGNANSIQSYCITELYRDKHDNIWIGSYLDGLSVLDWKTKKYTHFKFDVNNPNSIGGNNIWTITEDDDNIWIGTIGNGIDIYSLQSKTFTHLKNDPQNNSSLSNNDVFKILKDSKRKIWVATRNGLNACIDKKNFKRYLPNHKVKNSIMGAWIYDIFEDSKGNIWIGTDEALNLYQPATDDFVHFTEKEGLKGNALLSILEDKNYNLWISTNKGLSKFNLKTLQFRNFDIEDGLQGNEFNYTSSLIDSKGRFYFGGKNGFNRFHPDSINYNQRIIPTYLTDIKVNNSSLSAKSNEQLIDKNVNFLKEIKLNYKQNVISFEFAILNYTNPSKNEYAYKLEGFDKNWNHVGNLNNVTYTNLNPGKYTFKVKGANNDGFWNENPASIVISIAPPYWKTLWFRITIILLVAALIYYYFKQRTFQLEKQKHFLEIKVKERTSDLEDANSLLEERHEEISQRNEEIKIQKEIVESQHAKIEKAYHELSEYENHLEKIVEERTQELLIAKQKAEESDKLKSSFLANLSHEIRTPLNAIVGFSALLVDGNSSVHEQEMFKTMILNSSDALLNLINDILDFSRIEAGQIEISKTEVNLTKLFNEIEQLYSIELKKIKKNSNNKIEFRIIPNSDVLDNLLITDENRLKQIIHNLINNAIKFTPKGYVELSYKPTFDNNFLKFYVKDTGIGISKQDQNYIFGRFRKIENHTSNIFRGTGLGLSICKHLVKLLGGSIGVESELNVGSVFHFTIPYEIKKNEIPVELKPNIVMQYPNLENITILLAEDDDSNFFLMDFYLKKTNVSIIRAVNGRDAVTVFKQNPKLNMVLLDIKMPIMNGFEALKEMRLINSSAIIIAQTAHSYQEEIDRIIDEGFTDYILKPINAKKLYDMILKYI